MEERKRMEKKPIKRSKHLIQLSRDHHHSLLFCWKLRTGVRLNVDPERMAAYAAYFWQSHMQPHFTEEETILFPSVSTEIVERALGEHAAIAEQIKSIEAAREPQAFLKLADAVDDHVRYEERELFPLLEKLLTDAQLKEIGKQIADSSTHADAFADDFWVEIKQQKD